MADLRTINDGGPAFPAARTEQVGKHSDHGIVEEGSRNDAPTFGEVSYPGMSLRDWFAGQVSAAIIGGMISAKISTSVDDAAEVAGSAYLIADAMLAAREAPNA